MKHVLYVEDNDMKYRAAARFLHMEGISVIRACTFIDATNHMLEHGRNVAFIITDWSFPMGDRGNLAEACLGAGVVKMAVDLGIPYAVISGHDRPRDFEGTWVCAGDIAGTMQVIADAKAVAA